MKDISPRVALVLWAFDAMLLTLLMVARPCPPLYSAAVMRPAEVPSVVRNAPDEIFSGQSISKIGTAGSDTQCASDCFFVPLHPGTEHTQEKVDRAFSSDLASSDVVELQQERQDSVEPSYDGDGVELGVEPRPEESGSMWNSKLLFAGYIFAAGAFVVIALFPSSRSCHDAALQTELPLPDTKSSCCEHLPLSCENTVGAEVTDMPVELRGGAATSGCSSCEVESAGAAAGPQLRVSLDSSTQVDFVRHSSDDEMAKACCGSLAATSLEAFDDALRRMTKTESSVEELVLPLSVVEAYGSLLAGWHEAACRSAFENFVWSVQHKEEKEAHRRGGDVDVIVEKETVVHDQKGDNLKEPDAEVDEETLLRDVQAEIDALLEISAIREVQSAEAAETEKKPSFTRAGDGCIAIHSVADLLGEVNWADFRDLSTASCCPSSSAGGQLHHLSSVAPDEDEEVEDETSTANTTQHIAPSGGRETTSSGVAVTSVQQLIDLFHLGDPYLPKIEHRTPRR